MSDRNATTYNLILGTREDGDVIVVLEDIFSYGDGFKGATGAEIRPVAQELIDAALEDDEIEEWHEELWRADAGETNGTTKSLSEWVEDIDQDEYIDARYEEYGPLDTDVIAATLGVEAPARYTIEGLGRIFPRALEGIELIDSEEVRAAVAAINAVEAVNA
ncbi:hypothetical protein SEA_MAGRITTE_148 [Microbacterium phage Magritte]|nr:hypothetical protein SEA_MAGRITTE_148 [Microbacterium phage Magritte]